MREARKQRENDTATRGMKTRKAGGKMSKTSEDDSVSEHGVNSYG